MIGGGLAAATAGGICMGMQGIPMSSGAPEPYATTAVFLIAQTPLTAVLLVVWKLLLLYQKPTIDSSISDGESASAPLVTTMHVLPPGQHAPAVLGIVGGVIFSVAALGQVITISRLGATVGMPLTQLNLVVAGVWGIFFFREVEGRESVGVFFGSAALALLGGCMLRMA